MAQTTRSTNLFESVLRRPFRCYRLRSLSLCIRHSHGLVVVVHARRLRCGGGEGGGGGGGGW
eukprot:1708825-Rhodomonas_salina.1